VNRPLLVLVDAGPAFPADLRTQLPAALLQEVERSLNFRWVDPPAINVDELALALNCKGMDDACLRRAGENLKVDAVLLVAASSGARKEVVLSLVYVKAGKTRVQGVPVTETAATMTEIRSAVRGLLGPLKPTRLAVVTEPAGASVSLDGKTVGNTPFSVNDLPEGSHQVAVSLPGFQAQSTPVQVVVGESAEVRLTLQPQAAAAPKAPPTATPAPARDAELTQASAQAATEGPPAWHQVKWAAPVPGGLALLGAVVGLVAGAGLAVFGFFPGDAGPADAGPNLNTLLKLINNNTNPALVKQKQADDVARGVMIAGAVGLAVSALVMLGGVALLALSPLAIIFVD
jgi:hypothetical protein